MEHYCPKNYLIDYCGFKEEDFYNFCTRNSITKTNDGWPLFCIVRALNVERKRANRSGMGEEDQALKREKIRDLQIKNSIRLREFISRRAAKDRMRIICQTVANKIRYSIKNCAPRVIGILSARDVETVLTDSYNSAIEHIAQEVKALETWEEYGLSSFGRDSMVENSEQSASNGSGQKNEAPSKE